MCFVFQLKNGELTWNPQDGKIKKELVEQLKIAEEDQRVAMPPMMWDDSYRFDQSNPISDHSPMAVSGLGLAYHVLHDLVKANLDFTHRQEIHGNSLKNDSLVLQLQLHL